MTKKLDLILHNPSEDTEVEIVILALYCIYVSCEVHVEPAGPSV